MQQLSPERLLETRDEAKEKMTAFIIDLKKTIGLAGVDIGDSKQEQRIRQKADEDYGGKEAYIGDYERCKGIGETPVQVVKTKSELSTPNSDLMLRHGAILVSMNDQFDNPKKDTGYRCINSKVGFPVGNGEIHFVEVQIVAAQIEEVYDKTHHYLDIVREVSHGAQDRELTTDEKRIQAYAFAGCRYENGIASRDNGYDELLDQQRKTKYEVNRTTQNNMEHQIMALNDLLENFTAE